MTLRKKIFFTLGVIVAIVAAGVVGGLIYLFPKPPDNAAPQQAGKFRLLYREFSMRGDDCTYHMWHYASTDGVRLVYGLQVYDSPEEANRELQDGIARSQRFTGTIAQSEPRISRARESFGTRVIYHSSDDEAISMVITSGSWLAYFSSPSSSQKRASISDLEEFDRNLPF